MYHDLLINDNQLEKLPNIVYETYYSTENIAYTPNNFMIVYTALRTIDCHTVMTSTDFIHLILNSYFWSVHCIFKGFPIGSRTVTVPYIATE